MNKQTYIVSKDSFVDQVLRKFQAYAIIDIENKMSSLLRTEVRNETLDVKISELMEERNYYEHASNVQLLADLLDSARERYDDEDMSYAKAAFDLLLSKKKFSSYH